VNDARRIIRALEIALHTGQPSARLREVHRCADRPYRALQLALDPGKQVLDRRIDAACTRMLEAGLLREVRGLCERGYGPELPPMQAIGYRHLLPVVQGADTLRNALAAMQRDTRRFARRQRTWLRGVPEARWFDPAARDAIFAAVEEFLRGADAPAPHSV
jgi:tRNA dimethylallyltransferase